MRTASRIIGLMAVLAPVWPVAAQPVDGESIYLTNCVRCHETGITTLPDREAMLGLDAEHIENMLTGFSMASQGEALSHDQRRAVAEWLAGDPPGSLLPPIAAIPATAYCSSNPNVADPLAGAAWNGWSPDLANTRVQSAEAAGLTAADIPGLQLQWAFGVPGVQSTGTQPTVVGDRVFLGTRNGMFYSLDRETGCIAWLFEAEGGIRSTPTVRDEGDVRTVYFGDAFANFYALDALTGEERWRLSASGHPEATITGAAVYYDGRVYVPLSSLEEVAAQWPAYECCTFRGSLLVLDADTGDTLWNAYTIAPGAEPTGENAMGARSWGPSGAAIWSAPTIDPASGRLYVATGDSYSLPAAPTSDSVMAYELQSDKRLWSTQTLANDVWNVACVATGSGTANCPEGAGPDYDFGSSTVLVTRRDGSRILLAGQKSGVLYGFNPDNGELLWERQVGAGGVFGGIEWGFAADQRAAYVPISEAFELQAGDAGGLMAVDLMDGSVLWDVPPPQSSCVNRVRCNTGQPAAVSALPGVVFSGNLDGHLRAYDANTGNVIWDYDTVREFDTVNGVPAHGGAMNGPGASIAGGMVFVTAGYSSFGMMPGNVLLAFGVED